MLYCFIISVFILTLNRKTKITLRQSDGKANQLVSVALGNDKQLQCCVSYSASPSRSNVPSSTKNPFDVCRSCRNTVVIKMQLVQGWVWVLVSFSLQKTRGSKLLQGEAKYDPISDSTVFVGVLFVFSIMYENRTSDSDAIFC